LAIQDAEYERMEALIGRQSSTPLWYVLHDPIRGANGNDLVRKYVGVPHPGHPRRGPATTRRNSNIIATCRTWVNVPFRVGGREIDDLLAGVAHAEPRCSYCTEATARHEVVEITWGQW